MEAKSSLWKNKEFVAFIFLRFSLIFALFIQSTSVAYEIYKITGKELALGLIGLFEVIPIFLMAFYAGQLVDRLDKRQVLFKAIMSFMCASLLLMIINFSAIRESLGIYGYLGLSYFAFFILGLTRTFSGPSLFALLALVVKKENYSKAIPLSSSAFQLGAVSGPLVGGVVLAWLGIEAALIIAFATMCISLIMVWIISPKPPEIESLTMEEKPIQRIKEGLKFVFATPIILSVLCLDMFAVFFGGAEALLPVFAKDILQVGEVGYGWLRSAHGIGSIIMLAFLSLVPFLKTKVGAKLLGSVFLFGVCIIIFGLSKSVYLSFFILMGAGAFDAISMVVRQSILQYKTPEKLKGRVSSVNNIFVSSSNELGAFESGLLASLIGTIPTVIFGGSMTILVVIVIFFAAKSLRKVELN